MPDVSSSTKFFMFYINKDPQTELFMGEFRLYVEGYGSMVISSVDVANSTVYVDDNKQAFRLPLGAKSDQILFDELIGTDWFQRCKQHKGKPTYNDFPLAFLYQISDLNFKDAAWLRENGPSDGGVYGQVRVQIPKLTYSLSKLNFMLSHTFTSGSLPTATKKLVDFAVATLDTAVPELVRILDAIQSSTKSHRPANLSMLDGIICKFDALTSALTSNQKLLHARPFDLKFFLWEIEKDPRDLLPRGLLPKGKYIYVEGFGPMQILHAESHFVFVNPARPIESRCTPGEIPEEFKCINLGLHRKSDRRLFAQVVVSPWLTNKHKFASAENRKDYQPTFYDNLSALLAGETYNVEDKSLLSFMFSVESQEKKQ